MIVPIGLNVPFDAIGGGSLASDTLTAMELATRGRPMTVPQVTLSLTDAHAAALGKDYLRRAAVHRRTGRPFYLIPGLDIW